VRGIARLDFLWDGADGLNFNEINTIPGTMSLYLWAASGYSRETGVERLMRDAKGAQIYEGTNQIHRMIVADGLLRSLGVDSGA